VFKTAVNTKLQLKRVEILNALNKNVVRFLELIVFLAFGLAFTVYVISDIYEGFGTRFMGNVWVNWFGVSYFIFVLYSIIIGLFIMKHSQFFKHRLKSKFFWLLFIGSIYIIFIPFVKGENPF
jgi:hypothetical protein